MPENAALSEIQSEDVYVWYSHIQPEKTVEIINHLKEGYNAFALIYRPDEAYEDLAKAITYLYDHAKSAGIAVIMQYTGYTDTSEVDAPTYACVGTRDGIASAGTMKSWLEKLKKMEIPIEFHSYKGLPHGFGLGIGTVAEGWIDDAVQFWEAQMFFHSFFLLSPLSQQENNCIGIQKNRLPG